jgi:phytoene dehydrogenase-like protein
MLRGLLDRLVLLGGTLVGGCLPGYVTQYRQRVGGRLDQVQIDLAPFEEIARRYHDGDLGALVRHHLASADPTFKAEGQALQAMMDSLVRLRAMAEGLAGSLWQQLAFLVPNYDSEIGRATWHDYVPTFALDLQSLLVAGIIGVSCWLLFLALWRAIAWTVAVMAGGYRGPRRAH